MQFFDNSKIRPAKTGAYYVITEGGGHNIINYSAKHNMWNVREDPDQFFPEHDMTNMVACWAFLPKTDQALLHMIGREG